MTPGTIRDRIWIAALEVIREQGVFMVSDVEVDAGKSTIRDVLNEMENQGFLQREKEGAATWIADMKAFEMLQMSEEAKANLKMNDSISLSL